MKTILACAANLAKPSMSDFKKVEKIANEILDNIKQFSDSRIKEVSTWRIIWQGNLAGRY